jgi:hypothetical protein
MQPNKKIGLMFGLWTVGCFSVMNVFHGAPIVVNRFRMTTSTGPDVKIVIAIIQFAITVGTNFMMMFCIMLKKFQK